MGAFPYDAGVHTLGNRAGNMNGDSGLRLKTVVIPVETDVDYLVASVLPSAALSLTILTGGFMPYPQSCCVQFIADAGVANRTLTYTVRGIDQFGGVVTETLSTGTVTAAQTNSQFTSKAMSRVDSVVVDTAVAIEAGDRVTVGFLVDALNRYALPIEIKRVTDVIGGTRMVGGAPTAVDFGTGTINLSQMTIRNITGVAANDTLHMTVRSSRDFSG